MRRSAPYRNKKAAEISSGSLAVWCTSFIRGLQPVYVPQPVKGRHLLERSRLDVTLFIDERVNVVCHRTQCKFVGVQYSVTVGVVHMRVAIIVIVGRSVDIGKVVSRQ